MGSWFVDQGFSDATGGSAFGGAGTARKDPSQLTYTTPTGLLPNASGGIVRQPQGGGLLPIRDPNSLPQQPGGGVLANYDPNYRTTSGNIPPGWQVNEIGIPYDPNGAQGSSVGFDPRFQLQPTSGLVRQPQASGNDPAQPPSGASGNPTDRTTVEQQIAALMQQHGVTPGPRGSGPADLAYYTDEAMKTGGWTPGNAGYWTDRWQQDAGKAAGGGTSADGASPSMASGSLGAFLQPYTGTFTPPTGTDDPGFAFAQQQAIDAAQHTAAAKGNLFTGGFQKDLAGVIAGNALQNYQGAYNRAANTFGMNYDIFRNNQNDPFQKLYSVTGLGLNATNNANNTTSSYMNDLTDLTTSQGNVNANASVGNANNLNRGLSSLANWFQNYRAPSTSPYASPY